MIISKQKINSGTEKCKDKAERGKCNRGQREREGFILNKIRREQFSKNMTF